MGTQRGAEEVAGARERGPTRLKSTLSGLRVAANRPASLQISHLMTWQATWRTLQSFPRKCPTWLRWCTHNANMHWTHIHWIQNGSTAHVTTQQQPMDCEQRIVNLSHFLRFCKMLCHDMTLLWRKHARNQVKTMWEKPSSAPSFALTIEMC